MSESSKNYYSIQLVRAIAVLFVVLYHSHFLVETFPVGSRVDIPFLYEYGYLGVDMFFVVSGFIIAHVTTSPRFDIVQFFTKRFFRIYPILWFFCTAALISYYKFGLNLGQSLEYTTIYASFLAAPVQGYPIGYPIYAVAWSLSHEVIFYLIAGIVIHYLGHLYVLVVLFFMGLAGLLLNIYRINLPDLTGFIIMKTFSLYQLSFFVGMLIYMLRARLSSLGILPSGMGAIVSFWLVVRFPVVAPIFACLGSTFLIVMFLNAENRGCFNPTSRVLKYVLHLFFVIGNASFSLYMIHWIIFRWVGNEKVIKFFDLPNVSAETWRFGWIIASLIISLAMYYCIERPVIRLGNWIVSNSSRGIG